MPRLAEVLQLTFSHRALIMTDMAIPFAHGIFRGRRVAIVDDVVNVGTTMDEVRRQVSACQASEVELFALGARGRSTQLSRDFRLVDESPMEPVRYASFVQQVPVALQLLSKPYDLDFPILVSTLRPPFNSPDELYHWFSERFGDDCHLLTTEIEGKHELVRVTVDYHSGCDANLKARFYFDTAQGRCNIVPMAIPTRFLLNPVYDSNTWPGLVWLAASELLAGLPDDSPLLPEEGKARAELFVHSLAFASQVLEDVEEILAVEDGIPFSITDSALVFGPKFRATIKDVARDIGSAVRLSDELNMPDSRPELETGLLGRHLEASSDAREAVRLAREGHHFDALQKLFESLAKSVGATDCEAYALSWPYCAAQVAGTPYLRLRVGFTFHELVSFFEAYAVRDAGHPINARAIVSRLLDYLIDAGAVVSTFALYDGGYYRVYRKGESELWDRAANRALYAWKNSGRPMSSTRFTKLLAVLAYSSEVDSAGVVPAVAERGNTAYLPPSAADRTGAEIAGYLRRSGKLEPCRS